MDFNSQDFFTMEYEMLFEEKDGKTVLKSNTINKGSGIIAKAMMVFMKGTMIEQEDKNMTSLKKVIESNTTNYFRTIEQDTTLTEIKE